MKCSASKIFQTIYNFYPKYISYNRKKGKAYKKTKEYKAFIKKRKKAIKNHQQIEIFREELQNLLRLEIVNFSNLKNDVSYRYHCLLQAYNENQHNIDLELIIVVSYLDLYYCYFFAENAEDVIRDSLEDLEIQEKYLKIYQEKLEKLDLFFLQKGYHFVKNPMDSVDCIETELKNKGEVRIYDCLFSDLFK